MKPAPPPAAVTPPSFIDLETAARLAGVTRRTVQNKLATREIPPKAVKMEGRRKVVAVSALEAVFGVLAPRAGVSPSGDEMHGTVHGTFHEPPAELATLRATMAAKDTIIASLQATLDHERKDREHERENWRKTLERTQASLLAAQDTPTARALAGAPSKEGAIDVMPEATTKAQTETTTPRARRATKTTRPWWRSVFGG